MKTTYQKPITDITVLRTLNSVLDITEIDLGRYSRRASSGDANVQTEFEEEVVIPTQPNLWDE